MKRSLCLILGIFLLFSLTGCTNQKDSQNASNDSQANFAPENTAVPSENSSIQEAANAFSGGVIESQPTAEPVQPIEQTADQIQNSDAFNTTDVFGSYDEAALDSEHDSSGIDLSSYNFSTVSDTSLGFTYNYPSHWINNPGVYTICYREEVEAGDFPARVAVTRKKLTHTADEDDITNELKSYLRTIYKQYDAKTFEVGSLNKSIPFMGQAGYSTTYLAFSGETEVKGFVICCQIERTLYVFHFSASYSDYLSMESMMQYMCKSVKPA